MFICLSHPSSLTTASFAASTAGRAHKCSGTFHFAALVHCLYAGLQTLRSIAGLLQETNQEVPGWLQGMGARAPSFGGGKRRGGGGNRFGGQDFRRDNANHCRLASSLALGCVARLR